MLEIRFESVASLVFPVILDPRESALIRRAFLSIRGILIVGSFLAAIPRQNLGIVSQQGVNRMPAKSTVKRATEDLREGKAPATAAGEFVREEIEHVRHAGA